MLSPGGKGREREREREREKREREKVVSNCDYSWHFPAGDKFILFLVHFSCHCLRTVFLREARGTGALFPTLNHMCPSRLSSLIFSLFFAEKQFFTHPCIKSTAPARPNFKSIYIHSLKVHCLRHCRRITARLQLMSSLHCQWRSYARFLAASSWMEEGLVDSLCRLPFLL